MLSPGGISRDRGLVFNQSLRTSGRDSPRRSYVIVERSIVIVVFTYGLKSFVVEDVATLLASLGFRIPIVLDLCGGALPGFIGRFPAAGRLESFGARRKDRVSI